VPWLFVAGFTAASLVNGKLVVFGALGLFLSLLALSIANWLASMGAYGPSQTSGFALISLGFGIGVLVFGTFLMLGLLSKNV